MEIRRSTIAIAVLVVAFIGATSFAIAEDGAGFRHGGMHQYHQLNLTTAQKQQIKTTMEAQRATMHPLMQQMVSGRIAMMQATANGAFDQQKVQTIAAQQAQVMAQLAVARQAVEHQIYTEVLTLQQQAQLNQMRATRMERMTQRLGSADQPAAIAPGE